jgi:Ras-related protein Rab-23
MIENVEDAVKVIIVGDGGVGKSSLVRRYCKGEFTSEYKKTIGADFLEKEVFVKALNETVRMMLWDTAGQEVFDALTSQYYRGAGACVLAFSTTDRDSFESVKGWQEKVENVCGKGNIVLALIQTKIDLIDQAAVQNNEAEALAKSLGVKFFRTSCKENFNIDPVFEYLAESYVRKGQTEPDSMPIQQGVKGARKDGFTATTGPAEASNIVQVHNDEPAVRRAKSKKKLCGIL